jgi:signal transduction histidine kinase
MSPCHSVTLSLCHYVTISLLSLCHSVISRTKQQSDKLTKAEVSPTGNWQWAEYVLGSSAAVRKYQKRAEEMKTQRQAQGTTIRYQVEEDMKVPMPSTQIPMEVVAQSAIEQEQAQERSMEQEEEYDKGRGPTVEQERKEEERSKIARANKLANGVTAFRRSEVLVRTRSSLWPRGRGDQEGESDDGVA